MSGASHWCELAWLGGEQAEPGVVLDIDGGEITDVQTGVAKPPPGAERLEGLTLPGLANVHSHAFQRALRGRTHAGRGDFWTWRRAMYGAARNLDPDSYLPLARATFAEMLQAGITVVGEFHYVHHQVDGTPYEDPNAMGEAVLRAAAEAGIRITLIDACYLHGGFGVDPEAGQKRFCDRDAEAWAERVGALSDGPMSRIAAAIHSVRAVDPESAAVVAAWGPDRPLHAHVSEQPAENQGCLDAHGKTPSAVLADVGAVRPGFTAVHATHLNDADFEILSEGSVCLCPTTERDLADGIGPARRLADAGAALCTGSDSNAFIDPFEEARSIELDERLATGERGIHSGRELMTAATANGYAALGWTGGRIEPGAPADIVTVDLEGVRLAGTEADSALESVLYAAAPGDVRRVIVGGETVVGDGRHMRLDVARELADSIAAVAA